MVATASRRRTGPEIARALHFAFLGWKAEWYSFMGVCPSCDEFKHVAGRSREGVRCYRCHMGKHVYEGSTES